jgi:hypothetical protein
MDINSQHHNLLGNQISPKSEDSCILAAIFGSKSSISDKTLTGLDNMSNMADIL